MRKKINEREKFGGSNPKKITQNTGFVSKIFFFFKNLIFSKINSSMSTTIQLIFFQLHYVIHNSRVYFFPFINMFHRSHTNRKEESESDKKID